MHIILINIMKQLKREIKITFYFKMYSFETKSFFYIYKYNVITRQRVIHIEI